MAEKTHKLNLKQTNLKVRSWELVKSRQTYKFVTFIRLVLRWQIVWNAFNVGILSDIPTKDQSYKINFALKRLNLERLTYGLQQCFPTFRGSRHPCSVMQIFGGTPRWSNRFKDQGTVLICGTSDISSQHPCVPRHPSWESLVYIKEFRIALVFKHKMHTIGLALRSNQLWERLDRKKRYKITQRWKNWYWVRSNLIDFIISPTFYKELFC